MSSCSMKAHREEGMAANWEKEGGLEGGNIWRGCTSLYTEVGPVFRALAAT
jgi:hypothetical protein